jgi:nicotinamidase-related amidase
MYASYGYPAAPLRSMPLMTSGLGVSAPLATPYMGMGLGYSAGPATFRGPNVFPGAYGAALPRYTTTTTATARPRAPAGRSFTSADAKGGVAIDPRTTALVLIEYQNEFTSEGGKLHDAVKPVMEATDMLANSVDVCAAARRLGALVIHAPISFAQGGSDNPNKGLGILKGCADGELFQVGTWNAEICEAMAPSDGDLVVSGKKGLDAFPGTDLEKLLLENKIETVALGGFLTNCCVESTMRTACEKGFNVVTLTDCTAATSMDGQVAATEGTYGMFSTPMKKDAFLGELHSQ